MLHNLEPFVSCLLSNTICKILKNTFPSDIADIPSKPNVCVLTVLTGHAWYLFSVCVFRKHALNCHRMKPALFNVLCEIKEKTGGFSYLTVHREQKAKSWECYPLFKSSYHIKLNIEILIFFATELFNTVIYCVSCENVHY